MEEVITLLLSDSINKNTFFNDDFIVRYIFRGATAADMAYEVKQGAVNDDFGGRWSDVGLVIIHVGTNDVDNGKQRDIRPNVQAIVDYLQQVNPHIFIIINAILPRPRDFDWTNPIVQRVNQVMKLFCAQKRRVRFHPCHRSFLKFGRVRQDQHLYSYDGLHLNDRGGKRMARLMNQQIHLWYTSWDHRQ